MSAKTGFAACQNDCFGGGYESEAGQNNFITMFNANSHDCRMQCGSASVNGYGVFSACELCKALLELCHFWSRTQARWLTCPLRITSNDCLDFFFVDLWQVNGYQAFMPHSLGYARFYILICQKQNAVCSDCTLQSHS